MCRDGRRVDRLDFSNMPQQRIRPQRNQRAQQHSRQRRQNYHADACFVYRHSAFEAERGQEVNRQRDVKCLGKFQIALNKRRR